MGLFDNLTNTDQMEESTDNLGGGFQAVPTDIYDCDIKLMYHSQSQGGANAFTVVVDAGGQEVSETIYYTNKKGENFYADKQDASKRHPLPGFTTLNDLCLLVTGFGLAEQETEEKVVKIYDYEARKEIPKPVQCITAMHGQKVKLGIQREIVDKEKKGDDGQYHPTGDTRTQNAINKVFHAETGRTVVEVKNGVETPEFMNAWKERHAGKDRDRTKKTPNTGGASGSGRPGAAAAGGGARQGGGLFGN